MKAIVTVIGKDQKGIIAKVSITLSEMDVNIMDISQTLMQDYFVMIMMVDISSASTIGSLATKLDAKGKEIGVQIRIQHEDIFNSMHRI